MTGHRRAGAQAEGSAGRPGGKDRKPGNASRRAVRTRLLIISASIAIIGGGLAFLLARRANALIAFPLPADPAADSVRFTDFVGSQACAECHPDQFRLWSASTHGRAGGPATRELLLRAFDGRPIRFRDAIVRPVLGDDGSNAFIVEWTGRDPVRYAIEGVVGGGHMVGGGTQGFLTRYEDGTLRFLPFELIRREDTWFCNTGTRLDRGWLPITDSLRLADCGDWPPVRVFGNIPRFANCQECHGSQIQVAPRPEQPLATRLTSLSINCESCHGPGGRHIQVINAGAADGDIGMRALSTTAKDASVDLCLRCHALKDGLRPGFLPGRELTDFYSILLPLLSDAPVFADGRIRTFAYQQGHLWSDCFVSGSMTCVDCHDPHSQEYRDADYRPLPDRFDDGQCTSCHPSKAADPPTHTHHAEGSSGSRCVSCHMPYLQEPEVGNVLGYARSDHTIPVPRPAADAALGIENACQTCHRDRDAASLDRQASQWWGQLKPRPAPVDALMRFEAGEPGALDQALDLDSTGSPAPARAMALGRLLNERLHADMTDLDAATVRRLRSAAASDHLDIAALGLAGLHLARGNHAPTRRFLVDRLNTLGQRQNAVRRRWAILLGAIADGLREDGRFADAITVYDKTLEILPGNAGVLLNRGLARAAAGDLPEAQSDYQRSIAADSLGTLAWVNLGIARAATGDGGGAIDAYRGALRIDPREPLAWFNLGNLYFRADRPADAIDAYRRALDAAPGLAAAHFNLGRALILTDRLAEARSALRDGLEFEPGDGSARQALAQIDSVLATGSPGR